MSALSSAETGQPGGSRRGESRPAGPRACVGTGLALGEAGVEPGDARGKGWPGMPGVSLRNPSEDREAKGSRRGSSWEQAGVPAAKGSSQKQQQQNPGFLLKPLAVLAADLVRTPAPAARAPAPLTLSCLPAPGWQSCWLWEGNLGGR